MLCCIFSFAISFHLNYFSCESSIKLLYDEYKYQKQIILGQVFTPWDDHNAHGSYSSLLFVQMPRHKPLVHAESQFPVSFQGCHYSRLLLF